MSVSVYLRYSSFYHNRLCFRGKIQRRGESGVPVQHNWCDRNASDRWNAFSVDCGLHRTYALLLPPCQCSTAQGSACLLGAFFVAAAHRAHILPTSPGFSVLCVWGLVNRIFPRVDRISNSVQVRRCVLNWDSVTCVVWRHFGCCSCLLPSWSN